MDAIDIAVPLCVDPGPALSMPERQSPLPLAISDQTRMTSAPATLFLIDRQLAVRQAVEALLSREAGLRVIGQSDDLHDGVATIESLDAFPDVLLIDVRLHDPGVLSTLNEIARQHPESGVVIFTDCEGPGQVRSAIFAGVRGYVLKSADSHDLLRAVKIVAGGGAYLQDEVVPSVLKCLGQRASGRSDVQVLSPRQLRIVEAMSKGMTNKRIGALLGVNEETIKSYLKQIFEKLDAKDRTHAVAIALRQNLIR